MVDSLPVLSIQKWIMDGWYLLSGCLSTRIAHLFCNKILAVSLHYLFDGYTLVGWIASCTTYINLSQVSLCYNVFTT